MKQWIHHANQFLSGLAGWLMFAMMMLLIADVIMRTFGKPLLLMAELSVFVMMIVIYLGFPRCEEQHEHVRFEFLVNALEPGVRRKTSTAANLVAVAVIALLLYAVAKDAWSSYLVGSAIEGMTDIPIWPTKFIMVVGMVIFLLQGVVNLCVPAETPEVLDDAPGSE